MMIPWYHQVWMCKRSSAKGHWQAISTKFHRDCLEGFLSHGNLQRFYYVTVLGSIFWHTTRKFKEMATGLIVSVVLITRSCSGKFTCALPIQGKLGDIGMTLEKEIQGACRQTGFSQKISHLHRQEGRLWTFAS